MSGRFQKICKCGGGGLLQAHVSKCPVADFRKSANWGVGEFLQAHVSKCPVADLRKSANWGEFCNEISKLQICFFNRFCIKGLDLWYFPIYFSI